MTSLAFPSLSHLDTHLSLRSFIEGYSVSSADVDGYHQVMTCLNGDSVSHTTPHVLRWMNYMQSLSLGAIARVRTSPLESLIMFQSPSEGSGHINVLAATAPPSSTSTPHKSQSALVYSVEFLKHKHPYSYDHPECPKRVSSIWKAMNDAGLAQQCQLIAVREATDTELLRVHTSTLLNNVKTLNVDGQETFACVDSPRVARLAVGGLIDLCFAVADGVYANGFAVIRPPGHHADPDTCSGFCLYNNVGVAAKALIEESSRRSLKHSVKKVFILDWDVHHGNGTQTMFEADPSVLFISLHRGGGFYPFTGFVAETGEGEGKGYTVNIPWARPGVGDAEYLAAFHTIVMPIAKEFNPDIVLISAGFDAAIGDPLGGMCVSPAGYAAMTKMLLSVADGRVVVALEGGYNLRSISLSAVAVLEQLIEHHTKEPVAVDDVRELSSMVANLSLSTLEPISRHAADTLRAVAKVHCPRWRDVCVPDSLATMNDRERTKKAMGGVMVFDF